MADNSYKLEFTLSNGRIINAGTIVAPQGEAGKNGVTFTPSVSEAGILSWTNDGGLANPDPVNIKGDAAVITESDVAGWGFTKNVGTITEIKMNGSSKGTSGVVDLGTVLTEHQDISGKQDKITSSNKLAASLVSGLATVATSGSYDDLSNKPTIPTNYVTTDTTQIIDGLKTIKNHMQFQSDSMDVLSPPSSNQFRYLQFLDKNKKRVGLIGTRNITDGYAGVYLQAQNAATMGIESDSKGNVRTWTYTPPDADDSTQIANTAWVRSHNQALRGFDSANYYTVDGVKKYYPADNYFLVAYTDHCVNWQHVCAEMDVVDLDTRLAVYKLKVSGLLESATKNNITTYTNRGNIGVTDSFGQRLNNGSANINNEFFLVCRTTNKGRVRYEIWYNQRYSYNRHKFYFSVDEAHARTGVTQHFTWNKMRIDNGTDVAYAKAGVTAYMDSKKVNPTYIPTSSWGVDVFKTSLSDDESYTNVTIFNNNLPSVLYNVTQNRLNISSSIAVNDAGNVVEDSSNGITFAGTKSTTSMIRFANNDANTYGNGIVIGGGGVVIMGCGESSNALYSSLVKAQISAGKTAAAANTEVAQSENTYITSDNHIRLFSNCNNIANRKELEFNTSGQLVYTPTAGGTAYTYTLPKISYNPTKTGTLATTDQLKEYLVAGPSVKNVLFNTEKWVSKTWSGLTSFYGNYIWTDGNNIYYSSGSTQYVLNKATSTWTAKTWSGLTKFNGDYIWTDGDNIYYSNGSTQYVLNKATSTWTAKTWSGLTNVYGHSIWSDGDNIYYSSGSTQYVLNKATSTWTAKTWSGLTSFYGNRIWTDGDNIYYSYGSGQYVLNKATSTWTAKTWSGSPNIYGTNIWADGDNIYYSDSSVQHVLNKATSTWTDKTWSGLTSLSVDYIWTDGDNIYYSNGSNQYVLNKIKSYVKAKPSFN